MRIKKSVQYGFTYTMALLMLIGLIGFVEHKQTFRTISSVSVELVQPNGQYFLEEADLMALITEGGHLDFSGMNMSSLDLNLLEEKIESHQYTENVAAFIDQRGNLTVRSSQKVPMIRFADEKGNDMYMDEHGRLLPLSEKYTARVLILSGQKAYSAMHAEAESEDKMQLMELLNFIQADEFWKAQIAEVVWEKDEVILYPQIGNQVIEFGDLSKIEEKFRKLMIFYKRILPSQGWNRYARVNLNYENQIVCE
jgi:cell division protein FtsQ